MRFLRNPNTPAAVIRGTLLIGAGLVAGLVIGYSPRAERPAQTSTVTLPSPHVTPEAATFSPERGFSAAVQKSRAAVVNIYTRKVTAGRRISPDQLLLRRYFGLPEEQAPQEATSLGSGVVIDTSGLVLTNNHVVDGADEIAISFADGKAVRARIIGTDPDTDIAVLKVDRAGVSPLELATTAPLRVGDIVLAIGNPFGVGQTVTHGIVSALGRKGLGINALEDFIQTDAAINPGNSGGALIDTQGRLVGINDAIFSRSGGSQGIGFAIPVSLARQVADQLIRTGRVERGWLGIEVADVDPESAARLNMPEPGGVLVVGVADDGPGARAGLRAGDVIVALGKNTVRDANALIEIAIALKPGQSIDVAALRNGTKVKLALKAGRRPPLRLPTQSGQ